MPGFLEDLGSGIQSALQNPYVQAGLTAYLGALASGRPTWQGAATGGLMGLQQLMQQPWQEAQLQALQQKAQTEQLKAQNEQANQRLKNWAYQKFPEIAVASSIGGPGAGYLMNQLGGQRIADALDPQAGGALPGSQTQQPQIVGQLPNGRPIIQNPDGTTSTHRNMIVGIDGLQYVIPTIYGGRQVSEDQAIAIARQNNFTDPDTGQPLPSFPTVEAAQQFEQQAHKQLEQGTGPFAQGPAQGGRIQEQNLGERTGMPGALPWRPPPAAPAGAPRAAPGGAPSAASPPPGFDREGYLRVLRAGGKPADAMAVGMAPVIAGQKASQQRLTEANTVNALQTPDIRQQQLDLERERNDLNRQRMLLEANKPEPWVSVKGPTGEKFFDRRTKELVFEVPIEARVPAKELRGLKQLEGIYSAYERVRNMVDNGIYEDQDGNVVQGPKASEFIGWGRGGIKGAAGQALGKYSPLGANTVEENQFRNVLQLQINDYLKEESGLVVTFPELKRLLKVTPQAGQTPENFEANMREFPRRLRTIIQGLYDDYGIQGFRGFGGGGRSEGTSPLTSPSTAPGRRGAAPPPPSASAQRSAATPPTKGTQNVITRNPDGTFTLPRTGEKLTEQQLRERWQAAPPDSAFRRMEIR